MSNVANLGYLALKKESTKGTAVTPDVYAGLFSEALVTNHAHERLTPSVGQKNDTFDVSRGMRSHVGTIKILAEPNSAGYILDMILTKGTTTGGSDPYTHPFTLSPTTDPNSYTIDIAKAAKRVHRYIGCEAREVGIAFEDNYMVFNVAISALKSFTGREIASVSGVGPYTITLNSNYDAAPTTGLVVGDLIQVWDVSAGAYINAEVDALTATTIDVSEDVSAADAGDIVELRLATPSTNFGDPFKWSNTEFRFGATAAAALSASQIRLEQGSMWVLRHGMENDTGSQNSGGYDPERLNRITGGIDLTTKLLFDNPNDYNRFLELDKYACVIRHYANAQAHELRVTLNHIQRIDPAQQPNDSDSIIYDEGTWAAKYDSSDAQAFDVKVINAVSSI